MITVTVGSNLNRKSVVVEETATLKSVLENNGVDYSVGSTHLDGATVKAGDLDKTFASFGIKDKCSLITVVKGDAA